MFRFFLRVIEYVAELVGVDSVVIGSNIDGWIWTLNDVKDISDTWRVIERLKSVFSEEE